MDRSRVAIVIPALNESAKIAEVVQEVGDYGVPIVVDDGSTDGTADLARRAGAVVISYDCNRGYDAALNGGFAKAAELGCDLIISLDADGQHDPVLLQNFINQIEAGADIVVGARNKHPRVAEKVFAWYTRWRYGINDPLCGMKAYRTNVYCASGHFDTYRSIGTELMLYAAKHHYLFAEVPFVVNDRSGSSRFGCVFSGNYKIFRALLLSFWRIK